MSASLSPEDRLRLEELFDRAAELQPAEQPLFVERECGSNHALRAELDRLLEGLAGEDILQRIQTVAPSQAGSRIGSYQLLEQIGEGGMGEVYLAEQLEPVSRRVALKIIKSGMDTAQVVARFETERQTLALMTHPNIAQVFGGGATAGGRPYFVMELVAGAPVTDYCDAAKLTTRERLELFLGICDGVQHAHQKGIIHRDLKPSNLLVTEQDGGAVPKVIDFGVARATTGPLAERTLQTVVGQIVGTLAYMSPEQADPTSLDIDTRSDIYSLGVVLYELLTGLLPFEQHTAADVPFSELQRALREQGPPTPSTRLRRATGSDTATAIAPLRGTDERSLIRQLSGDLDWICLKALEKDPARRYASASELAQDLRRHLAHQPVLAGRPSALYRARKFVRRNRLSLAAGALTAAGVGAGIVGVASGRLDTLAAEQLARALEPQADEYRARVLLEEVDSLWPPHPEQLAELNEWLARARELAPSLAGHRTELAQVRARALPPADGEQAEAERNWSFASDVDRSTHDLLSKLVGMLEVLGDDDGGLLAADAFMPSFGWSVPRRLAFARSLEAGLAPGGAQAQAWAARLPEIRAAYPGLALEPQLGLVPIGPDPASGLWEFAHLMTGAPAVRGENGRLLLSEDTGLVLVLLPGGSFSMGAQAGDPPGQRAKAPAHTVELSPFFQSKYELTQGQWKRLTGENPSSYGPDRDWDPDWLASGAEASLLHPVENVSWTDCMDWLPRAGLTLPSEAQWEYATRAGTSTAYWTGEEVESLGPTRDPNTGELLVAANLSDVYGQNHGGEALQAPQHDFGDGSTMHWAVGNHRANAFGLEDVHGNVFEWCLDGHQSDFYVDSPRRDPVAPWVNEAADPRVYRGGSYRTASWTARSALRSYYPPLMKGNALGVRPARAIDPFEVRR